MLLNEYLENNIKKIFVINLDRRPDRLETFYKNIPFDASLVERISAIDGNSLRLNYPKRLFKLNELGCLLSHKIALKKIIDDETIEENDFFIIFEDDVKFSDKFSKSFPFLFENLKNKKEIKFFNKKFSLNYFLVFFGGRFHKNFTPDNILVKWIKINEELRDVNLFLRRQKTFSGSHCFDRTTHFIMMNKKTASLIHNKMEEIDLNYAPPIDVFYQDIQKIIPEMNFIECFPHICYSPITEDSDIQYSK